MMVPEKKMIHPNFILGLTSYFLLLSGVVLHANDLIAGKVFILSAFLSGAIHWLLSLVTVWTNRQLKQEETKRYFWLSLVIMIPPVAGMLYYLIERKHFLSRND